MTSGSYATKAGGFMTGLAERMEVNSYAGLKGHPRYAPFNLNDQPADGAEKRTWSGAGGIAAYLILSGITIAFSRGQAAIVENYGLSQETVLGIAWILQGVVALVCFVFIVRWLRN